MINLVNFQPLGSAQPAQPNSVSRAVNRVLWQTLALNLLVAGAKIAVGLATGAISMLADGFHSAMDASSNVIALIGSTIAGQPPDSNHPYGHQKYETFATLGIGLLLLFTSWNVLKSVLARLFEGGSPEVTALSFGVMLVTLAINLAVSSYERHKGKLLHSSLLLADADHTRSDIFVSLSVIISLVAVQLGWLWMDALVALVIVFVIGRTGWQIVRRASEVLSDCAVTDAAQVEKIVTSVEGVQSCHKIRSRGTDHATHLDLHIQVDGRMPLAQAHYLGHQAEDRLRQKLGITDVIVHVEPVEIPTAN
jgi:cation diffusion facilitator family transporter